MHLASYEWDFLKGLLFGTSYAILLFSVRHFVDKINENGDDIQELFSRLEECEKSSENRELKK